MTYKALTADAIIIDHILYVDQDKELTKIDISDDSVRKMTVPEF
mgnify:CR=1 FL=1